MSKANNRDKRKQTPKQKRAALARKLEKSLPAKSKRGGETSLSDADVRRAINLLNK